MKWIVFAGFLAFSIAACWLWWAKPQKVDMATYAPVDSLIYLESNRPLDVVETITSTDVWKDLAKITGPQHHSRRNHWLQRLTGWTGIGPVESVILARAQLAIVVTQLSTTEDGDMLRIRPEGAAIIETHTAERRIRAPVERALNTLAEMTYKEPIRRRTTIDGVEFIEWTAPQGGRQLVATIFGSLVIVGNSEQAVQKCLAVTVHRQPNLKEGSELDLMRIQLGGDRSLTFGYVPAEKSARLLSIGVPLMLGRPGDSEFERLITAASPKVFGSVGWSSHPYMTGIEDRYLISLQSSILARLKPHFGPGRLSPQFQRILPLNIHSITYYKFDNPVWAWQNLKTAISSQIDTLSAIVFNSLLKSALLPYGIQEPEKFLGAVVGEVLTMRLDQNAERPMLIAVVRDRRSLRELVIKEMLKNARSVRVGEAEILEDSQGEIAVGFIDEFVVLGTPLDVRRSAQNETANVTEVNENKLRRMTFFVPLSTSATILTYTNDEDRLRSFISSVVALQGAKTVRADAIEEMIASSPYSATKTTLGERGLERVTRSPMGQFSTLLPLVVTEQPTPSQNNPQAK
ncbi:MAG: hypothetical protein ABR556_09865 [Pyrinomonadaceae bacterium]